MISEQERMTIERCARQYAASRVLLFGSALERDDARDIDLGVEGIAPGLFFRFYGELLRSLRKPVDLADLSDDTIFSRMVREQGHVIYG